VSGSALRWISRRIFDESASKNLAGLSDFERKEEKGKEGKEKEGIVRDILFGL
jgi:hypothetical protein